MSGFTISVVMFSDINQYCLTCVRRQHSQIIFYQHKNRRLVQFMFHFPLFFWIPTHLISDKPNYYLLPALFSICGFILQLLNPLINLSNYALKCTLCKSDTIEHLHSIMLIYWHLKIFSMDFWCKVGFLTYFVGFFPVHFLS